MPGWATNEGLSQLPRLFPANACHFLYFPAWPTASASRLCAASSDTSPVADGPVNDAPYRLVTEVEFGDNVVVYSFTNLYGCKIGDNTRVGPFVEIQRGAVVGANCKIQSHSFICDGVTISDGVFIGHGVLFINDKYPRAAGSTGELQAAQDWTLLPITVGRGTALGSGVVVLGGVDIGERCMIGAGAVVTRSVPADSCVAGVPARAIASRRGSGRAGAEP
jgi:UDP-2-acetamido-3-amino-2,3-dideoxy-glucuronate N-acetyltransferase